MSMITTYAAGALAGLVYGFLVGFIKYVCLWKSTIKSDKKITSGNLYARMVISWIANFAALLLVFLLRNLLPFSFAAVLLAAAVGLSLSGKMAPMGEIVSHVKEKDS